MPEAGRPRTTIGIRLRTHPLALGAAVLTIGRFTYLLEAFAPLAFLPLRTRWIWLALPGLAGVLLASDSMVWRMGFHYELLWAPWLLMAAAWALVRIAQQHEVAARRWWAAALAICVIVLAAFDPMHPAHYLTPAPYQQSRDVAAAFGCIPRDARVAAHDEWFAHEALTYPDSTNVRAGMRDFNSYVVYTPRWRNAYVDLHVLPELRDGLTSGHYTLICRSGDVLVLRPSRRAE
jgi:uncharacterized membrane protein